MSLDSVFLCHISPQWAWKRQSEWNEKIPGSKKINLRKRVTLETKRRRGAGWVLERQQFVPLCVRHIYGALLMVWKKSLFWGSDLMKSSQWHNSDTSASWNCDGNGKASAFDCFFQFSALFTLKYIFSLFRFVSVHCFRSFRLKCLQL